jgi:hypothetical protein
LGRNLLVNFLASGGRAKFHSRKKRGPTFVSQGPFCGLITVRFAQEETAEVVFISTELYAALIPLKKKNSDFYLDFVAFSKLSKKILLKEGY